MSLLKKLAVGSLSLLALFRIRRIKPALALAEPPALTEVPADKRPTHAKYIAKRRRVVRSSATPRAV